MDDQIINTESTNTNEFLLDNLRKEKITLLKNRARIESKVNIIDDLLNKFNNINDFIQMLKVEEDDSMILEVEKETESLEAMVGKIKLLSLFTGPHDSCNCFFDINAGAGGTESHDWASMLLRMYLRFCERMNFKTEVIDMIPGEEAGIKSCTIKVYGNNAYGWLKNESGVHRLVRMSPYNANAKRMTSFASFFAYPEIDDDVNIEVNEKDLRIDTYRASGAGGQHVNKTDSAVRITHIPTGIVVQSQSDRSQHKNRAECMKVLKSKLYELEQKKRQDIIDQSTSDKIDASWGNQIRSYVMQPYQMVKDLRTQYESGNIKAVLDGDIEDFIKANLSKPKD